MSPERALDGALWPLDGHEAALEAVALATGMARRSGEGPSPGVGANTRCAANDDMYSVEVERAAQRLGLEAEPVEAPLSELGVLAKRCAPALLRVADETGTPAGLLAVVAPTITGKLRILTPDGRTIYAAPGLLEAVLARPVESSVGGAVDRLLDDAGIPSARRGPVKSALIREGLGRTPIRNAWILRGDAHEALAPQVRRAGLHRALAAFVAAHLTQHALFVGSWWLIGEGALRGRMDRGWLLAWALLLISTVPAKLAASWWQGRFAIGMGALLKERLLQGALALDETEVRREGAGQLLARVMESGSIASLALGAGFLTCTALLELGVAAAVLVTGAGGLHQTLLLLVWFAAVAAVAARLFAGQRAETRFRIRMTNGLVERMVGHRTRLVQEPPAQWHVHEDRELADYVRRVGDVDLWALRLQAMASRGWLIVGLVGLAPALLAGATTFELAVGLGGLLLAYRALGALAGGFAQIARAAIAWEQAAPLFQAQAQAEARVSTPAPPLGTAGGDVDAAPDDGPALLAANALSYRYDTSGPAVLRGATLEVRAGDRILLEGPSGGGKSTLAALLCGLQRPRSGLLLLRGYDLPSIGLAGWRKRVVASPQFHDNHIFTGTLAFNLLMGRAWPASARDMREAEEVCRELGLGELLDRMPAGMAQMVGESGWQLSHGERSRIFIARALLQNADLIVLDESFAALDPASLIRAMRCVVERARAVLVIAHP